MTASCGHTRRQTRAATLILCAGAISVPIASQKRAVADRAEVTRFLESLDRALERCAASGDFRPYAGAFDPIHPRKFEKQVGWLTQALGRGSQWNVRSSIQDLDHVAGIEISLIATEMHLEAEEATEDDTWTCYRYVGFTQGKDGRPRGVLDVEVHAPYLAEHPLSGHDHSTFGCPACNYEIRAGDDWLMVPHAPQRVGCLEAVSFYSLTRDLVVDTSIHVVGEEADARTLLRDYVDQRLGKARSVTLRPWLPARYRDTAIEGLTGAETAIETSDDVALRAVHFGPILYLFTGLGPAGSRDSATPAIETLLDSFHLRETDIRSLRVSLAPITMHTGGKLVEGDYVNDRHGVRFSPPAGFRPSLRCGGDLLHVVYCCLESEGRVSLRALAPPIGRARWTTLTAGWSLEQALHHRGLVATEDSGWVRSDADGHWRRDLLVQEGDDRSSRARACRAILVPSGRKLIVLDAMGTPDEIGTLRSTFDGLDWQD